MIPPGSAQVGICEWLQTHVGIRRQLICQVRWGLCMTTHLSMSQFDVLCVHATAAHTTNNPLGFSIRCCTTVAVDCGIF